MKPVHTGRNKSDLGGLGFFWVSLVVLSACSEPDRGSIDSAQSVSQSLVPALDAASLCEPLAPSTATYLYVSRSSGNDSTALAGDRTLPWATIGGALAAVPATLNNTYVIEVIDSATYPETVNITGKTTSPTHPLYLRTAVGANPTINNGGTGVPLTIATNNTLIVGMTISGPANTTTDGIVFSAATTNNSLLCNVISSNGDGINGAAGVQTSLTIEGNRIESNRKSAIVLTGGTTGLALRRNVIDNNGTTDPATGPGLDLTNATAPQILNNTFYNNSVASTSPTASPDVRIVTSSAVRLKNNVFSSLSSSRNKRSIRVDSGGSIDPASQYNLYWYPNVVTGFPNCPVAGDNFSVGGFCACYVAGGGPCGGSASWQGQTGADITGSNQADPLFVAPAGNPPDLHEMSQGGHWTAGGWIVDAATSPVVDRGNPADPVGSEPGPNGARINCGGYGGGPQASKTLGLKVVVVPTTGTAGTTIPVAIQVQNPNGTPNPTHNPFAANLSVSSGTAAVAPTSIVIPNGTSTVTVNLTDSVAEDVVLSLAETTTSGLVTASGTIGVLPTSAPEVSSFVALSRPSTNILLWNNSATRHDGVLLLRSTSGVPNTAPTNRTAYATGAAIGNATVVYVDNQSFASRITDQGLVNGARYYYRLFNHDQYNVYSPGNAPTSSGLFSDPTSGVSPSPQWCYNVGLPTPQQPFTDFGTAVYTASNARTFTGNLISSTPSLNGFERWRPIQLQGVVQSRPTVVPLFGSTAPFILTGDQSGFTYRIDPSTGLISWTGNGSVSIGSVQAQAAVQLNQYANPTFRAAYPNRDLVYFGTHNASTTNNQVWALSSVDGTAAWTYNPGNLDIISGEPMVDYANNRLWVASRAGSGGTQPSLRVLTVLTPPSVLASFNLGDIDNPVVLNPISSEAYVVTKTGVLYGFDLSTMTQHWTLNLGSPVSGYLVVVGYGFIVSTSTGVQRYLINPTTHAITAQWPNPSSPSPTPVTGPSAVRVDFGTSKCYLGDATGSLHRLDLTSGVDEKQISLSSQALGMPSLDRTTTPERIYVGGLDGRLCAMGLPF